MNTADLFILMRRMVKPLGSFVSTFAVSFIVISLLAGFAYIVLAAMFVIASGMWKMITESPPLAIAAIVILLVSLGCAAAMVISDKAEKKKNDD